MKAGRGLLALAAALAAAALCAPLAHAGSYDVHSCTVGSSFYGNNAWVRSINAGRGKRCARSRATRRARSPATCSSPVLQANVSYAPFIVGRAVVTAPPNTVITDYT